MQAAGLDGASEEAKWEGLCADLACCMLEPWKLIKLACAPLKKQLLALKPCGKML